MVDVKVAYADAAVVWPAALAATVSSLLQRVGMPVEDADTAADVLVSADLRGVDSHGVSNMLRSYVQNLRSGSINPRPTLRVVRESPATATLDSDFGLGIAMAPRAMAIAIEKARETGVGMVTVGNGRHLGMAAYHAMLALPHDMIGICTTAVGPYVVPTFGRQARMGTNPIAVAVPCGEEPAFVFDGATSAVAGNKILSLHRQGKLVPPGLLIDENGHPNSVPVPAPPTYADMAPLGSTQEAGSHKGYGLACVVEVLGSVLSSSAIGFMGGMGTANHFVAAMNVSAFAELETFKRDMDAFIRMLKATPPAVGEERVLVAGQPEWETEQERRARGIPLHPEVAEWFDAICDELDVSPRLERSVGLSAR